MGDWLGLSGKTVLVVGAGGFGAALVGGYLSAGSRVAVADKDAGHLELATLGWESDSAVAIKADVATADECNRVVDEALATLGHVDVFVHAVGVNRREPVTEISPADWDELLAVNLSSALWLGQRVGKEMEAQGGGRMVYLSSVSGLLAHPEHGAYAASKGGLNQLLKVMAVEWAEAGIAVNAVAPGYGLTPLTSAYCSQPGVMEGLLKQVPIGRLAVPDDIVGPTLFLSSDRAAYVTGHVMYVDGGRTLD